jgi:hypothetical protein
MRRRALSLSLSPTAQSMWQHTVTHVQDVHKRMVQFQEFIKNVFIFLHGHNIHCQQRKLSLFLMRYQQFAFHAYCGAAGPVSKMA